MASPDLLWFLVRNNNASMIKRNGYERPFSREAFNLRNTHSQKHSGFAQKRALDIQDNNGKGVVLSVKTKQNIPGAPKIAVTRPFRATIKAVNTAVSATQRKALGPVAQGRVSQIKKSQTRKAGVTKKTSVRRHGKARKDCNVVGL